MLFIFVSKYQKIITKQVGLFFFPPQSLFEVFHPKPSHFCYFVSQQKDVTNPTQIFKQMQPLSQNGKLLDISQNFFAI